MSNNQSAKLLFLLVFIFAFCLSDHGVYAFGAGNIPSFAYMEGRAFRHGDIEDALAELAKKGAGAGFALTSILKGSKFNGLDMKRVYFGNWLRDYSQAVDVASLKKLQLQTIINLCMVLGFMAHGYATHEFEVTPERLGVYLPTEHIDNPKGYADGEDARRYHPKLRGPVDPRELEIDPRTGMKNYIANEQGTWDNSKNLVRRTVERCIHIGRNHRQSGLKQDEYEAYRLLGQSLHTLEDFPAHSNFCELALVSMGHTEVFVHVGDQARIQAPHGKRVAPLVTGTFGSSDFIHSLLGEATDHLSEASVSDLNKEIDKARTKSLQTERSGPGSGPADPADVLRGLLFTLPGGSDGEISRDLEAVQKIRAGPQQGGKRPEDMSPQELHSVLWQVLTFRDSVVKKISKTIEKIPGLGPLIEKIMDSISVFVFTTLEPFLKPLLKSATTGLQSVSGEVIDNHDQYEVFNDPRASDPTHSFLSKDHFNLILNEPAGQLARLIVVHTVNLVTKAWDDKNANVNHIVEEILQCLFHPDFHNPNSKIQREMLQYMQTWVRGLKNQKAVLQRLSKNAVRNHENIRLAGEGGAAASQGSYADNQAHQFQHTLQGYTQGIPGVSQVQNIFGGGAGFARDGTGPRSGPGAPGFPGQGSANTNPSPVSGQAASYYGGNARPSGPPGSAINTGQYPPPSGPPPPGNMGNYAPPSAPPSSFTSSPSTPGAVQPHHHAGYSPSYAPSYSSPPPAFPGSAPPSFPGAPPQFPGGPALGGYAPPSGPPAFPGAPGGYAPPAGAPGGYAPPAGPPPFGFPDDRSPPQFPNMPGDASGFPKTFGGNDGRWQ